MGRGFLRPLGASDDLAHLVELEARVAVEHLRPVALAEVAEEVRLPRRAGEELLVDAVVVEARARASMMKYAPWSELLRSAVVSACTFLSSPAYAFFIAGLCGKVRGRCS